MIEEDSAVLRYVQSQGLEAAISTAMTQVVAEAPDDGVARLGDLLLKAAGAEGDRRKIQHAVDAALHELAPVLVERAAHIASTSSEAHRQRSESTWEIKGKYCCFLRSTQQARHAPVKNAACAQLSTLGLPNHTHAYCTRCTLFTAQPLQDGGSH